MTPILRAQGARFVRAGAELVGPLDLRVAAGETSAVRAPTALAASIAARMCAAIVKPTSGTILIGEYETRLQPAQAKRSVGFVDAGGFAGGAHAFKCELAFRAEVWGLERARVEARAREILLALGEEPYAHAVALALVGDVALVVLDQPPRRLVRAVRAYAALPAIVFTQVAVPQPPQRTAMLAGSAT